MNKFKKLVLILMSSLLVLSSSFLVPAIAMAEDAPSTWYNQSYKEWFSKVYGDSSPPSEIFGERYTAAQVQWIIYGLFANIISITSDPKIMSCIMDNTDLTSCADMIKPIVSINTQQKEKNLAQLVFADRPISGVTYLKGRIQNFSITPTVNAQSAGFGFTALNPVQDMWRASRNIAFGLFVLATVIFAFMIMFRVKISPQVVISVQSAIPKLISSLVLVTFSYAIAGFLIDLMYVFIGILSMALASFMPVIQPTAANVFSQLTLGNPLGAVGIDINTGIVGLIFIYLSPLLLVFLIFTILGVFAAPLTGSLSFWIPFILLIIVAIVGLWITFKTVWALLKAFVNILLLTIFAPLQLSMGVLIPNFGFNQWVKSYASQLSVFVVTGAIYYLSIIFFAQGVVIGLQGVLGGATMAIALLSPLLGLPLSTALFDKGLSLAGVSTWPPLLSFGGGNLGTGFLFLCVSFVLFTLIPKATEIVQGFISGKPFAYGSAIGESITQPFTGALRAMTAAQQIGTSYSTRFGTRKAGESQEKPTKLNDNRQPVEGTTPME